MIVEIIQQANSTEWNKEMTWYEEARMWALDLAGVTCKLCGKWLKSTMKNYFIDVAYPIRRRTFFVVVEA